MPDPVSGPLAAIPVPSARSKAISDDSLAWAGNPDGGDRENGAADQRIKPSLKRRAQIMTVETRASRTFSRLNLRSAVL